MIMIRNHRSSVMNKWRAARRNRRGSIALWTALTLPGLFAVLALGVEVSTWESTKVALQRTADMAAMAGVMNYNASGNATTASNAATWFAELNGVPSGQVQVAVVSGIQNSTDQALQVTVSQAVPAIVSSLFNASPSHTVSASATAEWVSLSSGGGSGGSAGGSGGQPCLLALSGTGSITGAGSTDLTMSGCALRSNGTITFSGAGTLNTSGIYAGGAISIPTWFNVTGSQNPNDGTIPDPYASDTALQNALTTAAGLTGVGNIACGSIGGVNGTAGQYTGNNNCNGTNALPNGGTCSSTGGVTCTLYPGNYGSFIVSSGGPYTFNFQPGLYLFSGQVSLTNNTTTNATGGVTIVAAGGLVGENTFNFNLTAPTPLEVSSTGGIAGVALASKTTTALTLSGAVNFYVDGVVYFPNAVFNASGSSGNVGATGVSCLEIVAASIEVSGASNFNSSGCSALGAISFTSVGSTSVSSSQIVQ